MIKWNHYQTDAFTQLEFDDRNLAIIARAGSGKSTFLEECNRRLGRQVRCVNTAFNTSIANSLRKRLPWYRTVGTMNSLGWGAVRQAFPRVDLDENKTFNFLQGQLSKDRKLFWKIQSSVKRVVSLFKQLNLQEMPENWNELTDLYGIELGEMGPSFREWLEKSYLWSIDNTNSFDYDDQIYQVLRRELPIERYDITFVDEMQDMSPLQIAFVGGLAERKVTVGDDRQAIYVFRGADVNAVARIVETYNSIQLPLSICYRCPKAVIRKAQTIVPDIEWGPDAEEGIETTIGKADWAKQKRDGDLVTCRTTAPLVQECLKDIREKRSAFVRGRDIGKKIYELIERIGLRCHNSQNLEVFMGELNNYNGMMQESLKRQGREVEAQLLSDRVETIEALSDEDVYRVSDIVVKMETLFKDGGEGIEYSTIHKVKGLERPIVYRLRPELCPHPKTPEHLIEIEQNCNYVQITRAQKELYTIRSDSHEVRGY